MSIFFPKILVLICIMKNEISRSVEKIKSGKVIVYPTDTIWGIGCDATNQKAVDKIYKIKNRPGSKSMIILVKDFEMLKNYIIDVPEKIEDFLRSATKPTTVIYKNPKDLAPNVIASDNTVAIRIVQNEFCNALINEFGKPIVSTSANLSGMPSPSSFNEIDPLLLKQVDYIVNLPAIETKNTASQIIRLNDSDEVEFLRK